MGILRTLSVIVFVLSAVFAQAQLSISMQDRKAAKEDILCIPVQVNNFENITSLNYAIEWDDTVLEFIGIEQLQLANLSPENFEKAGHQIHLNWETNESIGSSLANGTNLYELCFKVIGENGTNSSIKFSENTTLKATKADSGNSNIGINTQAAMVLVAPVVLNIENANVVPGESFCLDVTAEQFTDILTMQFTLAWNANIAVLDSITGYGLPFMDGSTFNLTNANLGICTVAWANIVGLGTTVSPDVPLFQLCFTAVGTEGEVTDLAVINLPTGIQVTDINSAGMHIGLDYTTATITIISQLAFDNVQINHVNCTNLFGGEINLDISGGTEPFNFNWVGPGTFTAMTEDLTGISAGNYMVTVSDSSNPAKILMGSFEVIGDFVTPTASIAPAQTITCEHPEITLDASASSSGSIFDLEWITFDGNIISGANSLTPEVNSPGTYDLIITNETNGCAALASVEVDINTTLPFADAGMDLELDCSNDMTVTLDGSNSSTGINFTYSWSSWNGNVVSQAGTLFPVVDGTGNYQLVVTDTMNGCIAISNMEVTLNTNYPIASAGVDTSITCASSTIVLDGTNSSVGNNFSYNWQSPDGNIVSGATSINPTVDLAGTYVIEVTNTTTMCASTDTVLVSLDMLPPIANAGMDGVITCNNSSIELDGSASSTGTNYIYEWTSINGNIVSGANSLTPIIDAVGLYQLLVTNLDNACTSSDMVNVTEFFDLPDAIIELPSILTCLNSTIQLDASNSSMGDEFNYSWTSGNGNIVSGANSLMPMVDAAGTYVLEVLNTANNCIQTAMTTVEADMMAPIADAGLDVGLACASTTISLDGTGSSMGDEFSYSWTTSLGNIIDGANDLTPSVDALGDYVLEVSNTENGCTASDVVAVILDTSLASAMAGADTSICVDSFLLQGNDPLGITGVWTSNSGAIIHTPNAATSKVTGLDYGINEFSYSLSTPDCPDYDTDIIQIIVQPPPTASDDYFDLSANTEIHVVDLSYNDGILLDDWSLLFVDVPTSANIENNLDGTIDVYPLQLNGLRSFNYRLCNNLCENLCDTAFVELNISNVDTSVNVPSGITPNNDGLNDLFIIAEIEKDPYAFPNNELLIFNRWGEVVYKSKPYENDWGGENNNGEALPEGTYYYVLRLNIAEGLVYKGDITILR